MVLRSGGTTYRYGYQGAYAEKDGETGWDAFELRMYDSRIARWLTTDPAGQFASPYIAMGNDPVNGIDKDGGTDDCPTCPVGTQTLPTVTVYTHTGMTSGIVNISHLDGIPVTLNIQEDRLIKTNYQAYGPKSATISSAPHVDNYTQAFYDQWTRDYYSSHGYNPDTK